jgi:hypothetical protein
MESIRTGCKYVQAGKMEFREGSFYMGGSRSIELAYFVVLVFLRQSCDKARAKLLTI